MNGLFDRFGQVNPLVWVVIVLAAVLGFGARKLVALMKLPEEKQLKTVVMMKSGALLLVVLTFIFVVMMQ